MAQTRKWRDADVARVGHLCARYLVRFEHRFTLASTDFFYPTHPDFASLRSRCVSFGINVPTFCCCVCFPCWSRFLFPFSGSVFCYFVFQLQAFFFSASFFNDFWFCFSRFVLCVDRLASPWLCRCSEQTGPRPGAAPRTSDRNQTARFEVSW